jgi:GDP-mannose 6-dehydrogenase
VRISVFGLGYVGSVTAACFAKAGHEVWAVDPQPEKVAAVQAGLSPVLEPGLEELIGAQVRAGKLRATRSSAEAIASSDLALVCVGTPGKPNGQADLGAIERVSHDIGAGLREHRGDYTVVLRSTVLPGTTERVFGPLARNRAGAFRVGVAVNPEFMREGTAIRDFANPPFIIAGCSDGADAATLRALYRGIEGQFLQTDLKTAELVKFVCNAFHALKICFANEVAEIAAAHGADGNEVMRLFTLDRKLNISEAYLRPGFAFGGSCLPKDVRALTQAARSAEVEAPLLSAIVQSNEEQLRRGFSKVRAAGRRRVGLVGLAFKPGSDDVRDSPFLALVELLIGKGYEVRIYDRHLSLANLVGSNRRQLQERLPHVASLLCGSLKALLAHAEVVVLDHDGPEAERALALIEPRHALVVLNGKAEHERPAARQVGLAS